MSSPSSWGTRPRREYPIETKPFFLTSEFVGSVLAICGIAITAASSDAFGAWRAWILITAIVGRLHGQPRDRQIRHSLALV